MPFFLVPSDDSGLDGTYHNLGRQMTQTQGVVLAGRSTSDAERVMALLSATTQRPLDRGNLAALCFLIETDPQERWENLRTSYSFEFDPGARSEALSAELDRLVGAGYANTSSPYVALPAGVQWAGRIGGWAELLVEAREAVAAYVNLATPLVEQAINRASEPAVAPDALPLSN